MTMQHSAATGHADRHAKEVQPNAVMDTLGASYARKYYSVMLIFVCLVARQVDTCLPATLTT